LCLISYRKRRHDTPRVLPVADLPASAHFLLLFYCCLSSAR
jgi:hypothetical protein